MSRNVVLLVLDTVRKDVFDKKASWVREHSNVSFERAYAPSSWTVPSHASMFTGELLHRHGVHAHDINYRKLDLDDTFLPELDRHTIGLSANSFLSPRFGFDRLFDEFDSLHGNEELLFGGIDSASFIEESEASGVWKYLEYLRTAAAESALTPSLANAAYMKLNNATLKLPVPRFGDYGARAVLDEGVERASRSEPFFLFANVVDAHAPHEVLRGYDTDVPASWTSRQHGVWEVNNEGVGEFPEYLETFDELYGCAVEYLDGRIEAFVEQLQDATDGETTVIVTSDHGEELGRECERTLGHKIPSAAVSHMPLEVLNAPPSWSNDAVTDVVSLLDLGALVAGIIGDYEPDISREIAPVERIGDSSPPDEQSDFWDRGIRATFGTDDAYEWDTMGNQYHFTVGKSSATLVSETDDVPSVHRDLFKDALLDVKAAAESTGSALSESVDERTQERLEDLGYM